jgi:hypothetical protein
MCSTMSARASSRVWWAAPVDPLRLQGAEEALDHRIVPAVFLAAHAALDAMLREQPGEGIAGKLHAAIAMEDPLPLWRPAARHNAICSASQTKALVRPRPSDQPTTLRENKSMTTARYIHPCPVQMDR